MSYNLTDSSFLDTKPFGIMYNTPLEYIPNLVPTYRDQSDPALGSMIKDIHEWKAFINIINEKDCSEIINNIQ